MTKRKWLPRSAPRLRARPRLEALEHIIAPTVELSPITLTGNPVFEGGVVTVSGKYTVIQPVGGAFMRIDWDDGTPQQVIPLSEGIDVPFSINHTMADDGPTNTDSNPTYLATVKVRLEDTGPRTLTAQDGGKYRAYDVPGLKINLGTVLAADTTGMTGIKSAGLDNSNDAAVVVPLTGTFRFYGQNFTGVNVTDNGLLSFNGQQLSGSNIGLTDVGKVALICPYWDDLRTDTALSDRVLYRPVDLDGNGQDDYFIIEWSAVPRSKATSAQTGTFQALLQLNTGTTNGDIIFNYIDTDFNDSAVSFGASATVGIQSGSTPQKGFTDISTFRSSGTFRDSQAVRFSVLNNISVAQQGGPEAFGYTAWNMPFEVRLDLEPFVPGSMNGNINLLGGAGVFDDISGNVASVFRVGDTFNYYGQIYGETSTINVTDNGIIVFDGVNKSGVNTNLTATPIQATIAALWDEWSGADSISFVIGRSIDFDGDNKSEFLVIEWNKMQNKGAPNNSATWQVILEMNTDARNVGDIYFNYPDTTVGDANFNAGASATVGIKDVGPQGGRTMLVNHGVNGVNLADQKAVGIFLTFTPAQSATVTVNNVAPTLQVGQNITINEGDRLTRTIGIVDASGKTATGGGGTAVTIGDEFTYSIDYGDGTAIKTGVVTQGGRAFTFDHFYADNGSYTVTINASDDDTGTAPTKSFVVTVLNVAPEINFTAEEQLIKPGRLANFPIIASFTDPGYTYAPAGTLEVFRYEIDWGDGSPLTIVNNFVGTPGGPDVPSIGSFSAKHPYTKGGTFDVIIRVFDDDGGSDSTTLKVGVGSPHLTVFGADEGGGPLVVAYDSTVRVNEAAFEFYAYDQKFRGGVRVAAADFNGDSLADIVTAPGPGGGPHIKIFDGGTGAVISSFFAYAPSFSGGVYVAAADVDGDMVPDVITGPGKGGGPHIRVFSGATGAEIRSFFAYAPSFTGGVRIAAADVNGDKRADIITGAGPGGGPHVRVFDGKTGQIITEFFAYNASFTGGVNVAVGNINSSKNVEIITGTGLGGPPLVGIFDATTGVRLNQFNAYPPGSPGNPPPVTGDQLWSSGVYVGLTDLHNDGVLDLVVGPGAGRTGRVRIFDSTFPDQTRDFTVFDPTFLGGAFVGGN